MVAINQIDYACAHSFEETIEKGNQACHDDSRMFLMLFCIYYVSIHSHMSINLGIMCVCIMNTKKKTTINMNYAASQTL